MSLYVKDNVYVSPNFIENEPIIVEDALKEMADIINNDDTVFETDPETPASIRRDIKTLKKALLLRDLRKERTQLHDLLALR